MRRILHLALDPFVVTRTFVGGTVITPNHRAADALGVPYESLERLAAKRLSDAGMVVASVVASHQALLRAVATVSGSGDARGDAQFWQGAVNEVLRAGTDLE